jgi:hypothetical protein
VRYSDVGKRDLAFPAREAHDTRSELGAREADAIRAKRTSRESRESVDPMLMMAL